MKAMTMGGTHLGNRLGVRLGVRRGLRSHLLGQRAVAALPAQGTEVGDGRADKEALNLGLLDGHGRELLDGLLGRRAHATAHGRRTHSAQGLGAGSTSQHLRTTSGDCVSTSCTLALTTVGKANRGSRPATQGTNYRWGGALATIAESGF